jgi:serine/threonine protein kinase
MDNKLINAKKYTDIFGETEHTENEVKEIYKEYVRIVHPDVEGGSEELFKKLHKFYINALTDIEKNAYGQFIFRTINISSTTYNHMIYNEKIFEKGDISTIYKSKSKNSKLDDEIISITKMSNSPRDNDLLLNENKNIKKINESLNDKDKMFFPQLLDSLVIRDNNKDYRMNIFKDMSDTCYTLDSLKNRLNNKTGFENEHLVWLFRKLLYAAGLTHENNIIHGAITPKNILVEPENHGIILIDWCYSVSKDRNVVAISNEYKDFYPEEILNKQSVTYSTDLYMIVKNIIFASGGDVKNNILPDTIDKRFRLFFKGCLQKNKNARPKYYIDLLDEFDGLLRKIGEPYYPKRYVKLKYSK